MFRTALLVTLLVVIIATPAKAGLVLVHVGELDTAIAKAIMAGTVPTTWSGFTDKEVESYFSRASDDMNRIDGSWIRRINKILEDLAGVNAKTLEERQRNTKNLLYLRPLLSGYLPERSSDSPEDYVGVYRYGFPSEPAWVFQFRFYHHPHLTVMEKGVIGSKPAK
ncbi:MAG: hypothetical protein WC764_03255 [Candidatus Paceibacterota bacterium]|jgi:hypothetical protein